MHLFLVCNIYRRTMFNKILLVITLGMILGGCGLIGKLVTHAEAHIYENRETGELLYCSNDQGENTTDFKYVGTGKVPKDQIVYCDLEGGTSL